MITFERFVDAILHILDRYSFEQKDGKLVSMGSSLLSIKVPYEASIDLESLKEQVTAVDRENYPELEIYSECYYEVAVNTRMCYMHKPLLKTKMEDTINHIEYEVGTASEKYYIQLIIRLIREHEKRNDDRLFNPFFLPMRDAFSGFFEDDQYIKGFYEVISKEVPVTTIKIKTIHEKSLEQFQSLRSSFQFIYMYNTATSLCECSDLRSFLNYKYSSTIPRSNNQFEAPRKRYVEDVIEYYKQAMASVDAYTKYLSFYHVIEYFFDEVFKRHIANDLREKLTHPNFSYKSDDKIYEVAKFIRKKIKSAEEAGQGNEFDSLTYVINEYVKRDDVIARLKDYNADYVNLYETKPITFCNAPTINWNDESQYIQSLAKRIYTTRNSLVHSKSGHNSERYRHYYDELALQKELPLIQTVAEQVIIHSGIEL